MAYSSWSVVFGEQPSASKWNILGTNDAEFNSLIQRNGTGFSLLDSSGLEVIKGATVASPVNEVTATNAATGNNPTLTPTGDDTNIHLAATGKGTGGFIYKNPYKFSAYHNTTQSLNADATVAFNTELYDTGGNFASNTFTAPIAGYYHFDATIYVQSAANTSVAFKINTTISHRGTFAIGGGNDIGADVSADIQLAASDTVVVVFISSASPRTLFGGAGAPYYTRFNGHLIST